MELLKQIEAKQKCTLVIESCVNKEQLESAHNYVKLYYKNLGFKIMVL